VFLFCYTCKKTTKIPAQNGLVLKKLNLIGSLDLTYSSVRLPTWIISLFFRGSLLCITSPRIEKQFGSFRLITQVYLVSVNKVPGYCHSALACPRLRLGDAESRTCWKDWIPAFAGMTTLFQNSSLYTVTIYGSSPKKLI
jgi:hypothetical protein